MKYRKKPVVVEAVKWTGENVKEIAAFMGSSKRRLHYQRCAR